jgi:hypothetical protein
MAEDNVIEFYLVGEAYGRLTGHNPGTICRSE